MIHDATVEVTCDSDNCNYNDSVDLTAGTRDSYIANDRDIEKTLTNRGWKVIDDKHYCPNCTEEMDSNNGKSR